MNSQGFLTSDVFQCRHNQMSKKWIPVGCLVLLLFGYASPGHAELYVAGYVGFNGYEKFQANDSEPSTLLRVNPQSVFYDQPQGIDMGIKVGYFLSEPRWLGLEIERYSATGVALEPTPRLYGPDTALIVGAANLMVRYLWVSPYNPEAAVGPYVGVGPGLFWINSVQQLNCTEESCSYRSLKDTSPGLNALAGVRLHLPYSFMAFVELKFNRVTFTFGDGQDRIRGVYSAQFLNLGVGFVF